MKSFDKNPVINNVVLWTKKERERERQKDWWNSKENSEISKGPDLGKT